MFFKKDQVLLTLQERANEKMERLRQEYAESLFESESQIDEVVRTNSTLKVGGKTFKTVTFKTVDEANKFMEKNDEWGVIGEKDGVIHVADLADDGVSEDVASIDEATSHFERTLDDGTVFRVVDRSVVNAPGKQDKYEMLLIGFDGKKHSLGTHQSVNGSEAFYNNHIMNKSFDQIKKKFSHLIK